MISNYNFCSYIKNVTNRHRINIVLSNTLNSYNASFTAEISCKIDEGNSDVPNNV